MGADTADPKRAIAFTFSCDNPLPRNKVVLRLAAIIRQFSLKRLPDYFKFISDKLRSVVLLGLLLWSCCANDTAEAHHSSQDEKLHLFPKQSRQRLMF